MALVLIFALSFIIPMFTAFSSNPITVTIDGHPVTFPDQEPVIISNRTLVPVRGVFEKMGFEVYWDSHYRVGRLISADFTIIIPADTPYFWVNGNAITPDVPQQIINDRLMLPFRAVAEAVGASAIWSGTQRTAAIISPVNTTVPTPSPDPVTPTPPPQEPPQITPPPYNYQPTPPPVPPTPPPTPPPQETMPPLYTPPPNIHHPDPEEPDRWYPPNPPITINDYLFWSIQSRYTIFDVEFFRVENGEIVSVMAQTYGSPESAFYVWADINDIRNIELIGATVMITSDAITLPSSMATVGSSRWISLYLSPEFLYYLEGENGLLLAESLARTLNGMWRPIDGVIGLKLFICPLDDVDGMWCPYWDDYVYSSSAIFRYYNYFN